MASLLSRKQVKKRVPSFQGSITLSFSNFLTGYARPMVEVGDCIPASPVFIASEEFYLCGSRWVLVVYPFGSEEEGDCLAVRLRNMTNKAVDLSYEVSIKRRPQDAASIKFDTDEDSDPRSSFTGNEPRQDVFEPQGSANDEWGIDDLILLEELHPLIVDDTLVCSIYMEVFGDVDLEQQPISLLIAASDDVSDADLIKMADKDLVLLKKTTGGQGFGQIEGKQNTIVQKRGAPPPQEDTTKRDRHRLI